MTDYEFIISFMVFYLGLVGCWFWCKFCRKSYHVTPVSHNFNVLVNNFVSPQTNTSARNPLTSQTQTNTFLTDIISNSNEKSHEISVNDIHLGFSSPGHVRKPKRIYKINLPV